MTAPTTTGTTSRYHEAYAAWKADPQAFWGEAAKAIDWFTPPETVFDPKAGTYGRWFEGGVTNVCHNALDRHVATRGDQAALIYDSAMTGEVAAWTYAEMRDEVAALAGALRETGVEAGDRVVIYMPMIPQAVFAMLACARLGAVHSVVFGGFAGHELAKRFNDAQPKAMVTASCGIEPGRTVEYKPLYEHALKEAQHVPETVIVKQRDSGSR